MGRENNSAEEGLCEVLGEEAGGCGMRSRASRRIGVIVDLSESFADPQGSFYCGTTEDEKRAAVDIARGSHLTVYTADAHPAECPEFVENGGRFPRHNLVTPTDPALSPPPCKERKRTPRAKLSARPIAEIADVVRGRSSGLIAPRHVFFQTPRSVQCGLPDMDVSDLEREFGVPWIKEGPEAIDSLQYVVSGKMMFNGAGTTVTPTTAEHPLACNYGVPKTEDNAFTMLRVRHGQGEGLWFAVCGVVLSICVYETAAGIKQLFPLARVTIVRDATTPLPAPSSSSPGQGTDWYQVVKSMSEQIGVEFLNSKDVLSSWREGDVKDAEAF